MQLNKRPPRQSRSLLDYVLPTLLVLGIATPFTDLWEQTFELLLLPLFIWSLWRHGFGSRWAVAASALPLVWIAWLGASGGWGTASSYEEWDHTSLAALMTALFFVVITIYVRASPLSHLVALGKVLVLAAMSSLSIGLILHLSKGGIAVERLSGIGIFEHEIMGAYVATIFAACALHFAWSARGGPARVVMLLYIAIAFVYITFTGSRSGMAVYICTLGCYVAVASGTIKAVRIAVVGSVTFFAILMMLYALFPSMSDFLLQTLERRSYRLAIWSEAWILSLERPILGHGIGDDTRFVGWIYHPHNLHLSNLFYAGVVGLLLGLMTYVATLWMALQEPSRNCKALALSLFAYLFSSVLLETQLPIKKADVIWYQFWVPLGLIWGLTFRRKASAEQGSRTQTD